MGALMAKPDIWMPLYIGDYLADTMHLTTEQHGAYLLLIMAYWKNGGPLPSADLSLAAICRLSGDAWSMHKHTLASFFDTISDSSLWILPRAEKEMNKAGINQEKRTLRAQKAAAARWSNDAPSNAPGNAPSNQQAMLNECPSPSPSHKDLKEPSLRSVKKSLPKKKSVFELPAWIDQQAWDGFVDMRKEIKKPITENGKDLAVKKLERLAHDGHNPDAVLNQSTFLSWQGLFAIKQEYQNGFGSTNTGTNRESRPSLVERVRQRGEENERLRQAALEPIDDGAFDVEFSRIHEADGSIVAADD